MSTEKYFLEQNELSFITSIRSWGAQLQGSFKQFQSQLTHSCNLFLPLHELHPIYLCSDLIAVNQFRELEDGKEPPIKQQLAVRRLPSLEDVLHKHQECCRSWGSWHSPGQLPAAAAQHCPAGSTFTRAPSGRARHNRRCSSTGTVWVTPHTTRHSPNFSGTLCSRVRD